MLHIATKNPYKAQITNAKNNNDNENKLLLQTTHYSSTI